MWELLQGWWRRFWYWRGWRWRVWRWAGRPLLLLTGLFFLLHGLFPFQPEVQYGPVVTDRNGTLLNAYLSHDDKWRMYTRLDEISPTLRKAILAKEDRYFYWHPGVNPLAIGRALWNNLLTGRRTSGASTITMQVVRLLEPRPRTYWSKLVEAFRALQLELRYSKDEILQLYLNLAPYGGNIEGVKAASWLYFDRPPELLSLSQATVLSLIPNQPNTMQPRRHNRERIRQARDYWLRYYEVQGVFDGPQVASALAEPIEAIRRPAPQRAPHLARLMVKNIPNKALITSTIDAEMQARAQEIARQYVRRIRTENISNAAVLVVDNRNGEIVSWVGSADFFDESADGQVDGVLAVRSPGSTLKPFLYAQAFARGQLTPRQKLLDVPVNYGGYVPENYDEKFRGLVTAEFALAQSLNIPPVRLLNEYGLRRFQRELERAGCAHLQDGPDGLGLSLILGGCGMQLFELTGLYTALANRGRRHRLQYRLPNGWQRWLALANRPARDALEPWLHPAAVWQVSRILQNLARPDLPFGYESAEGVPRIAWKTGTSYGRRDAWAVGYNPRFTIGVWCGNFTGEGAPGLSGAEIATPLLFDIFVALQADAPQPTWFPKPASIAQREICSRSGHLPQHFCENRVSAEYIPGHSPMQHCTFKKNYWVNADQTISYCTRCLPEEGFREVLYDNLPPELVVFQAKKGITVNFPPPHNPHCTRAIAHQPPEIVSPTPGAEYIIDRLNPAKIALRAQAAPDVPAIHWFVNQEYLGSAPPGEDFFITPDSGLVEIRCADGKGGSDNIRITVTSY